MEGYRVGKRRRDLILSARQKGIRSGDSTRASYICVKALLATGKTAANPKMPLHFDGKQC